MTDHPDYCALSYVWGNTKEEFVPSVPIIVDLQQMKITQTLYEFLLHLQASNWTMPCWVDGVCMNQCDSYEKSAQIFNIPRIYENAKRMIVWVQNAAKGPD